MGLESACCHATSDGHRVNKDEPPPRRLPITSVQRRCADCGEWRWLCDWTHIEDTSQEVPA